MITHEEMRERINNINKFELVDTEVMTLDYITQQEKKDKLLELYQEREKSRVTVDGFLKSWELTKQIKELEEELK